ncbi:hypothetical protein M422DRAFT_266288 [Sphaerobolus stellatus SS14]|uniref:Uncharacterized protein n=1 Tax=Sphaerobolus stellatus (strain SS14) TaxID=990650 RepID=A0A0C9V349_SPHS4|nr:hypothetical protein M422DRAFT_266288 [Sphaerobolus stellatus SS14]
MTLDLAAEQRAISKGLSRQSSTMLTEVPRVARKVPRNCRWPWCIAAMMAVVFFFLRYHFYMASAKVDAVANLQHQLGLSIHEVSRVRLHQWSRMERFHSDARVAEVQMDWIIHFDWFSNETKRLEIERWLNETQFIQSEVYKEIEEIKAGIAEDDARFQQIHAYAFDASQRGMNELYLPIYRHLLRSLKYSRDAWFEYHEGMKVLEIVYSNGIVALKGF